MDSHVVLAACKAYQFAKWKKVKGTDGEAEYIGFSLTRLFALSGLVLEQRNDVR